METPLVVSATERLVCALASLLQDDELLLLFLVILTGALLGRLTIAGVRLGLAGVLFAGLAFSAWVRPVQGGLQITNELRELGLVLFVYCVGLTSGPGFFSAWRTRGVRSSAVVGCALIVGAAITVGGGSLFDLDRGQMAGVFCGALTNTPALGAATDRLIGTTLALQPVVGYSVTYPFGVFGALFSFRLFARWFKASLESERLAAAQQRLSIHTINFKITNPNIVGKAIGELRIREQLGVILSRLRRGADVLVPNKYTVLQKNDIVTAVCDGQTRKDASRFFGEASEEHLEAQRTQVDMRRVLVSKREHVGCALEDLNLDQKFGAQVTRIRRADVDFVPTSELRLELGDRLRIVAPVGSLRAVSTFFGDSERELAEVDYVALALGLSAGLMVAHLPLSFFGTDLRLGAAGGPLVVALALGRLTRTGPLTWTLSYEANKVLRELGLLLFLAGVGVSAGAGIHAVFTHDGLTLFLLGAVVTVTSTLVVLALAKAWAGAGIVSSMGTASGMQTQPASLEAAYELSGRSEETYLSYALVYPVAMIGKILLAQLIAALA